MKPSILVNSSGYKNRYGHPSTSVVKTIQDLHIDMYDTQMYGAIRLVMIGKIIIVESSYKGIISICIS